MGVRRAGAGGAGAPLRLVAIPIRRHGRSFARPCFSSWRSPSPARAAPRPHGRRTEAFRSPRTTRPSPISTKGVSTSPGPRGIGTTGSTPPPRPRPWSALPAGHSDQRAVAFAVSSAEPDETGRLPYTIWFWPAPKAIWESVREQPQGDTATLPTQWSPTEPRKIVEAYSLASVQIRGGAVFEWHPDGKSVVFLDADGAHRQSVRSVDVETAATSEASPIRGASLAFSISPDGRHLLCAAEDPGGGSFGPLAGPDRLESRRMAADRVAPGPAGRSQPATRGDARRGGRSSSARPSATAWRVVDPIHAAGPHPTSRRTRGGGRGGQRRIDACPGDLVGSATRGAAGDRAPWGGPPRSPLVEGRRPRGLSLTASSSWRTARPGKRSGWAASRGSKASWAGRPWAIEWPT